MARIVSPSDICTKAANVFPELQKHLPVTPLLRARSTDAEHADLFFKCDNFQRTGSFKIRGALSKLIAARTAGNNGPFVTASSGNHGIACATAASLLGGDLTVWLPKDVDTLKLEKILAFGVVTKLVEGDSGLIEQMARSAAAEQNAAYISPYSDADIIAGQASAGLEIISQNNEGPFDNIFISVGGGGLISGVASVMKQAHPDLRVWAISAAGSAAMDAALEAGKIYDIKHQATLADGVAGGIEHDTITYDLCRRLIDQRLKISEDEIASALRSLAYQEGMVTEGAAALAYAGFLKVKDRLRGQRSLVLLCGANISEDRLRAVLTKT